MAPRYATRRIRAALILLAILLPSARLASGQGAFVLLNERNHPELRWMELRTEHFRIFYHDPLEGWARDAASILERFHPSLCRRLDTFPSAPTRVYISDQDQIANAAAVGWDYIFVWIPSHPAAAGHSGRRAWFEEVLAHEYTHIMVSWASRTWIGNTAFLLGLYPPRWLHEGVAQWTAEDWSVFRGDETIAAAVLDGSIDRNPAGVPGSGRLLYARGNARIRWLAATYGDSSVARLLRPGGLLGLYTYRAGERRALGKEAAGVWDRFRRSMISFYGERYRRGESPDSLGRNLDSGLSYPAGFALSRDGVREWWTGQAARGHPEASLFRRLGSKGRQERGRQERIVSGGVTGRPVPLPDGRCVLSRFHRAAHGSWIEDLGIWEPRKGFRFLTFGKRVAEPGIVSDDGIAALQDSPLGPSVVRIPIPSGDGSFEPEPIRRFDRGWALYSLSSAPSGDRFIVSAVEPRGEPLLVGYVVDRDRGVRQALSETGASLRGTVWLDDEALAWTSQRTGIEEIRSGAWRRGIDRIVSDSARTSVGTGVAVCGTLRDSIIALDRTSRIRTRTMSLSPTRRPARWIGSDRERLFPFPANPSVFPDTSIDPVIEGPYPYRALREVRPWLLLPLIGPQSGDLGIGGFGIWAEPLLRHAWGGFLYADAEHAADPDRALFYLTSRWGPWAAAFHSNINLPARVLSGRLLYERMNETGIAVMSPLSAGSDPNVEGWIDGFAKASWIRPRGRGFHTPLGPPERYSTIEIGLGGGRTRIPPEGSGAAGPRNGSGFHASASISLPVGSDGVRFARGALGGFLARALPSPISPTFWIDAGLRGASSAVPAQEYEGLDTDPQQRPIPGWPGIRGSFFLRGRPHAHAGRVLLHATAELRIPVLPDPGLRGPGISVTGGTLAPFLEGAHVWAPPAASFRRARSRLSWGAEARFAASIAQFPVVPAVAWGRPLGRPDRGEGEEGSWSFRLTTSVPIAPPFNPPTAIRTLLKGAIAVDGPMPVVGGIE